MGALESTQRDQDSTLENENISWQQAHAALSRLARERAAADAEEGRWLLAAQRAAVHVYLGYGAFSEYVERLFAYKPRWTQEKLRVAEALEGLPALFRALSNGELSWSAVRELTRVVVTDTEHEWLEFARGKTLRQLERVLAGRRPGDTPGALPDPSAQRHVLRFEVAAEAFALFRDALRELHRRAGSALDDDSALLEMARCVLGGPRDEGRASYQIVLAVCSECGSAHQHADGGLVPLGPELTRMAHCDAQHLPPPVEPSALPANDAEPDDTPETDADAAHQSTRAHVSAPSPRPALPVAPRRSRAIQPIAPAKRRAVLLRDERRCQIPGCQNTRWVDVHHLELKSEGGRHSLDNLVCLCSAHHRAAHYGKLLLERASGGALRVRHADGSAYGGAVRPQAIDVRTKVFSALRQLGFRESQVRAALEQLLREAAGAQASFDGLLRAALARLCPARGRP